MINIADLKDPNDTQGRTYRQINAAMTHKITAGSLVEVNHCTPGENDGIRLFVVFRGRDCDQTPLYWLSAEKEDMNKDPHNPFNKWVGGYSEESLTVIKEA